MGRAALPVFDDHTILGNPPKVVAISDASRYRAVASLCRQQAAYRPDQSWQLLSQAERWEHLAEAELCKPFKAAISIQAPAG
jgi:hypothetical protein